MKFPLSTLVLACIASTAVAAPAPADESAAAADIIIGTKSKFFLLLQSSDNRVTGKCVTALYAGAGLADAVITQCGSAPPKDYTFTSKNGTISYLGYGGPTKAAVRAKSGWPSNSWGPVSINVNDPGSSFTYTKAGGFVQNVGDGSPVNGLGFLACQWAHKGQFQLFALGDKTAPVLANCAKVKVVKGCYNSDSGCINNAF
ncbi:hypothetical protein Micbo1qcDRAFT_179122 [Microdochium bolleyi]|uniref:DUF7907 domain-containing protein n=1 Tax=Microdochium bolleyi TaxID=196109 RepID=A0A136IQR3_9PEZI|nr:hypothetical protein Micbo1qcDRAFT_179122 [Microdochium bolleyi]